MNDFVTKTGITPVNIPAKEKNINLIFKSGKIRKLNNSTYKFIIASMGFIAHYDLQGFQSNYANLKYFAQKLQTSEYSNDLNYNLKWADRFETDPDHTRFYGRAYVVSVSSAIRKIVAIARKYYPMLLGFC